VKIRWDTSAGAEVNARTCLPGLVGEYFTLGREVTAREDAAPEELHRFRLATKRLRYTIELFRPCYGKTLEERLDELRRIQQFLGDANDCATTGRIASRLFPRAGGERRKVEEFLAARAASDQAKFRAYWREKFDGRGRERAWVGYFARGRRAV
jgi:CHAD domain-containing protein